MANRRWAQAAVMDWQGSNREDLPAILPDARPRAFQEAEVRLQRHVEAVFESDRQEGRASNPRARPFSHHAENEQSDRRSSGWRGEANEGRWLRTDPQTLALVSVEATREPDRETDGQVGGAIEVQSAVGAGSLATRRFPTVLGICQSRLGSQVPRPVVYADDAEPTRTDEESGSDLTQSSRVDSQLVSSQRGAFLGRCREIQQQSKTNHEKIVRLSYLRSR